MSEFPYVLVPSRLRDFLSRIPSTGVPSKLTAQELAARGFKSSNDRAIASLLRAIKFLDQNSQPTSAWKDYRNPKIGPTVLGAAVKSAYSALFEVYPDAHVRSDEEIKNLIRSKTKGGDRVVSAMVQTFKTLASLSAFGESDIGERPMLEVGGVVAEPIGEKVESWGLTSRKKAGIIEIELPQLKLRVECKSEISAGEVETVKAWLEKVVLPWLSFHATLNEAPSKKRI